MLARSRLFRFASVGALIFAIGAACSTTTDAESTADLVRGVREGMESWKLENTPYVVTQVEFQDDYKFSENTKSVERTGDEVFVVQIDDPLLLLSTNPEFSSVPMEQFYAGGPLEMLAAGIRSAPDEILSRVTRVFLSIRDLRQADVELTPTVMRLVVEGKLSGLDAFKHPSTVLTALGHGS